MNVELCFQILVNRVDISMSIKVIFHNVLSIVIKELKLISTFTSYFCFPSYKRKRYHYIHFQELVKKVGKFEFDNRRKIIQNLIHKSVLRLKLAKLLESRIHGIKRDS